MKYNKDNMENIYNYDRNIVDKINENIEIYELYDNDSIGYAVAMEYVNWRFKYYDENHKSVIYYFVENAYDYDGVGKMIEYAGALNKAFKDNDYHSLLWIVNNNEALHKYFNDLKNFYGIDKKEKLEKEYIEYTTKYPDNTVAKKLLPLIQNAKSEFLQIVKDKRTWKVKEIENEQKVLEQLYEENYDKFNKIFFNQLQLLKKKI